MGVDHSRVREKKACSTQPATIQEVDEEEDEDNEVLEHTVHVGRHTYARMINYVRTYMYLQITSDSLHQRVSANTHSPPGPLLSGTCTFTCECTIIM